LNDKEGNAINIAVEKNSNRIYGEGSGLQGRYFKVVGVKDFPTGQTILLKEVGAE
jgi:hypothetical protein